MSYSSVKPNYSTTDKIQKEIFDIVLHLKKDSAIYLLITSITIFVAIYSSAYGHSNRVSLFSYMYVMKLLVPVSLLTAGCGYFFILLFRREPKPLRCYWGKVIIICEYRARVISGFILLTAISVFMSCFSTIKGLIPLIHPFKFDMLFHDIDLWLFGGAEPWSVLHFYLYSPYITQVINLCYNLWFFLMWAVLCYFLLASPSVLRTRFFVCWILSWTILGMITAMLLSSAGPAFASSLGYNNHSYDLLILLLQEQDAWLINRGWGGVYSLDTQNQLWQTYETGKEMLGSGISAMPSMHVSIAVLMALVMGKLNKKLGIVFWLYAAVIYIGSISLGWHYAVDGIVSAPMTWLLWKISGNIKLVRFDQHEVS
ncbi:phosphatase PAP2 family protein [Vibrio kasasachensis]|uniref:phosphatase PAP2 family protein n=1 Tax=Vibrio kasasachensis TaxID=2910248 RepID=UPI003D114F7D